MPKLGFLFMLLALLVPAAWSMAADQAVVLETIEGVVTEAEVGVRLGDIAKGRGIQGAPPPDLVRKVVIAMLQSKIMEREALARGLDQDPVVVAALDQARRDVFKAYLMRSLEETIQIPDQSAAARDYYDTHLKEFTAPTRIQVSHILLKLDCDCLSCDCLAQREEKGVKAKQILDRLAKGENFTQLAMELSEDQASAALGGSLKQWLTGEELDPHFARAAFALEKGKTSDIVATRFGFHIIRLDDRAQEKQLSFEEVKAGIVDKLKKEYLTKEKSKIAKSYEDRAAAGTWNEEALQRLIRDTGEQGTQGPVTPAETKVKP